MKQFTTYFTELHIYIKEMQTGSDGNGMLWLADFSTLDKCNQTRVRAPCQFIPSFQSCLQSRIYILLQAPFLFPDVSNSLLCSSWDCNEASGHISEQGKGLYLTMLQCITQELLNLLTAEAECTWPSHSLQKQRAHTAPAAHPWEPALLSSLLTHIHDRAEENGTQGTDRRIHDHDVQPAQGKRKHLSFRFCLSPILIAYYWNAPFSSPKTNPFSACHISMLTI